MGSGVWPLAVATRLAKPPQHYRPRPYHPGIIAAAAGLRPLMLRPLRPLEGWPGGICEGGGEVSGRRRRARPLMGACRCTPAVFRLSQLALGKAFGSGGFERLVPVGCADCSASTSGLSTWWSSTALDETWF